MYNYNKQVESQNSAQINNILNSFPEFARDYFYYCATIRNYSSRTILNYAQDIRLFFRHLVTVNPALKSMDDITLDYLEKLTPLDIQEFLSAITTYSKSALNIDKIAVITNPRTTAQSDIITNKEPGKSRKIASIRSFYKYYYGMGLIKNNPTTVISPPKRHKKNIIKLDTEESNFLISSMQNKTALTEKQQIYGDKTYYRDLAIITLFLGTGIRVSELVGINIKDINWRDLSIAIIRKGGNEELIYMNNAVASRIQDYIEYERNADPDEPALFISRKQQRLSVRSVERIVKKYTQSTVSNKRITPHKLRSTYGTALYEATSDSMLVATALGHSNLASVNRYVETGNKDRKRASAEVTWLNSDD